MRVLMNLWEWPPYHSGGLGIAAAALARAVARAGAEVLVHAWTAHAPELESYPGGGVLDVRPGQGSIRSGGSRSSYVGLGLDGVRRFAAATTELARSERFDIIHAHDWHAFPGAIAARSLSGRPLVVQLHSFEQDRVCSEAAGVDRARERIERAGIAAAARVLCVSHGSSTQAAELHPTGPRLRVIHGAVEPELALPARVPAPPRMDGADPQVLFLGRLTHQKAPGRLLAAMPLILEQLPETRLILVGDGDLRDGLEREVRRRGLGARVDFRGWLSREEALACIDRASLLVMPSRREPFGLAALEAAARGVPVVLDRVCGVSEVLTEAPTVDSARPADLAAEILRLLRSPEACQDLGARLAAQAAAATWDDRASSLLRIYSELVANP